MDKYYMMLGLFLVFVGIFGIIIRKNLITILVATEIMLNGVNVSLVAVSHFLGKVDAQVMSIIILTVAASEVAIGLGLVVSIFRLKGYEASEEIAELRD
ncbi:NADH-quinone oxidoreductase subunit NuoK [Hydrogenobaculum acidophilum]